ncbi:MAG: hypothetical protein ABIA93_07040 [Candidatus Woesearchaeota archaeon]
MPDDTFRGYRFTIRLVIVLIVAAFVFTIARNAMKEPTVTGRVVASDNLSVNAPNLVLLVDGQAITTDLGPYTEASGDPKYFIVQQSNPDLANCQFKGRLITCTPQSSMPGTSRVTVRAVLDTSTAESTFDVIVRPKPDRISLVMMIPDIRINQGDHEITFDVSPYFNNPTPKQYTVTMNDIAGLDAKVDGTIITIWAENSWDGEGYYRFTAWQEGKRTDSNLVHVYRSKGSLW